MDSRDKNDEEIKRTARILEIVQLIAVRPKQYRARELAKRFEVSDRMIKKDLQVIRHGLRLRLNASSSGYYFDEVPQLPAVTYVFTEALALLQAAQVARHVSGIDQPIWRRRLLD